MRAIQLIVIVFSLAVGIYILTNIESTGKVEQREKPADREYLGEIFHLDEHRVSPDVDHLTFELVLGRTLKYVDEAPPSVIISSADSEIVAIDSSGNSDPRKPYLFPVRLKPGHTELTVDYRVFCCNSGPGAVCFFKEGRIIVPVTVAADGDHNFEISQMIDD